MDSLNDISRLVKALEAGNYNAAPSTLVGGAALQVEDLSNVLEVVTFDMKHIKLQNILKVESCKSLTAQFTRQLSHGSFNMMAQIEGAVGSEATSDYARIIVPMAFYSQVRRVTLPSMMVATVDGVQSGDRAARDAAANIAGQMEFEIFRGKADFSNAGVFDANPLAVPANLPGMQGADMQIRLSDSQFNAKDSMFASYGASRSVVIPGGGTLGQEMIEDASTRSAIGFGEADLLLVDPIVLGAYNKITLSKERVILAGSPQDGTGSQLRRQWVAGGTISVEASNFLQGRTSPDPTNSNSPGAPTMSLGRVGGSTGLAAGVYQYYCTAFNELGESAPCAVAPLTVTAGDQVTVTITPPGAGTVRGFNVYRSPAGGTAASAKFIGRVANSNAATTAFIDLGNKLPGFVTGYLLQANTMCLKELSPYSRVKLAQTDLSMPEAHFRFATLANMQPRKNVLIDNLVGSI